MISACSFLHEYRIQFILATLFLESPPGEHAAREAQTVSMEAAPIILIRIEKGKKL